MTFDELDARMRSFETARDQFAATDALLIARIDGRSFTRLTKDLLDLERPFDIRFRDWMLATVEHLMTCGFRVCFGYTQSDEISLLFDPAESGFGRSIRKWTSILAGEASAALSVRVGRPAAFDCRIIELPQLETVVDYFRWRCEDAKRNALNAWCYWTLCGEGHSATAATRQIESVSIEDKRALLSARGIDFDALPHWQRHGTGIVWEQYDKPAVNPQTGERVTAHRKRLQTLPDLPRREEWTEWMQRILTPIQTE